MSREELYSMTNAPPCHWESHHSRIHVHCRTRRYSNHCRDQHATLDNEIIPKRALCKAGKKALIAHGIGICYTTPICLWDGSVFKIDLLLELCEVCARKFSFMVYSATSDIFEEVVEYHLGLDVVCVGVALKALGRHIRDIDGLFRRCFLFQHKLLSPNRSTSRRTCSIMRIVIATQWRSNGSPALPRTV